MAFTMSDYLGTGTADYTAANLEVVCQQVLTITPSKNQQLLWTDANTPLSINIDDDETFIVDLIYNYITQANAEIVMDFWLNATKGNGSNRTFYWEHPTDGEVYVSRFLKTPQHKAYAHDYEGVMNIQLYVSAYVA